MDASTFMNTRITEQRLRDLDREVSLRRQIAEHLSARRSLRTAARRDRRTHTLAA